MSISYNAAFFILVRCMFCTSHVVVVLADGVGYGGGERGVGSAAVVVVLIGLCTSSTARQPASVVVRMDFDLFGKVHGHYLRKRQGPFLLIVDCECCMQMGHEWMIMIWYEIVGIFTAMAERVS